MVLDLYPCQEDNFRFARPVPSPQVTRQLKMDLGAASSSTTTRSPVVTGTPLSPVKSAAAPPSQFRFPEPNQRQALDRRDSLFERPTEHTHLTSKLAKLGADWESSKAASGATAATPSASTKAEVTPPTVSVSVSTFVFYFPLFSARISNPCVCERSRMEK